MRTKDNNIKKNDNYNDDKIKDPKDVRLGVFLLIIGYFFFVFITFWIITSKISPPSDEDMNKYPYLIQFLIKDKIYGLFILIFLPTMFCVLFFRKSALYSFRHSS